MYRVLIADDEPSVAVSLKSSISWKELGLEVVGVADNGNDVLKFLEKESVDILILDIRMPGLNGLEVCEQVRNMHENLQIIIISGYAEFSYAERAIRYGVLGYCLKPLEYDKITRLLLKAEKNCEKWNRTTGEMDILEAIDRNDAEEIRNKMQFAGFTEEYAYVIVSVGDTRLCLETPCIVVEMGRDQYGYICRDAVSPVQLNKMMQENEILGIGYMKQSVKAEEIPRTLSSCLTKAFQFWISPEESICGELNMVESVAHLEEIHRFLVKNKWDSVKEKLKSLKKDKYRDFTIRSALRLCNMIHNGSLFLGAENDYYVYSLRQLTSDYRNIISMFEMLYQDITEAEEQKKNGLEYTNTAFMKLMEYIEDQYTNDISLGSVAQHCHMSSSYVSQLFKKETGMTFVHYITQLRMEEAIRLLQTTKKTTAEISALVGFNDYFYFLKTFKKYTGKTLSQYRAEI